MTENPPIRVLIADSQPLMRQGLCAILDHEPDIRVVAQASNAREAIAAYREHRPDITVIDLQLPELECLNAIKTIRTENPRAHILILTAYSGGEDIYRGLRAGASGYLLKESLTQEVVEAIRAIHAGQKRIGPEVAARLAERTETDALSESERNVLRELAQGKSNQEIAVALTLSEGTVKFHVNNILLKLGASNRTEAVVTAIKRGLVRVV